jgi:hypothetical protein
MAESFLQAQLKRIKDLTEQISNVRSLHHEADVPVQSADDRGATRQPVAVRRSSSRPSRRRHR